MKGQIVADFIIEHRVDKQLDLNVGYVIFTPWKLHFDGSVRKDGCGVGVVIISPNGAVLEALNQLDHDCTDNQTEYEVLLFGLENLHGSETCGRIWRFFIGGAASFQGMLMFKWLFKCLS
jgi:hypothetical protein